MTFGKDQDAKEASILGITKEREQNTFASPKVRQAISDGLKEKWKDPNYREKKLGQLEDARKQINTSKAGRKSRLFENKIAETIKADKVFLPQEVCDRIIVRDGKIIFVEIKRKDKRQQRLKPKQKEFKKIAKDSYEVIYG